MLTASVGLAQARPNNFGNQSNFSTNVLLRKAHYHIMGNNAQMTWTWPTVSLISLIDALKDVLPNCHLSENAVAFSI